MSEYSHLFDVVSRELWCEAGIAKHGLQGFMVTPEMALKIAFAKQ